MKVLKHWIGKYLFVREVTKQDEVFQALTSVTLIEILNYKRPCSCV